MKSKKKYENNQPMRVYYGHSIRKYNTPEEMMEEEFIKEWYTHIPSPRMLELCNPKDVPNPTRDMKIYFDKIRDWADVTIFSEYKDHVGKGVYDEIALALKLKKQAWVLRKWKGTYRFERIDHLEIDQGDNDWKIYYGKIVSYNDLNPDLKEEPTITIETKEDDSPFDLSTFGVCKNCGAHLWHSYIANTEYKVHEDARIVEMKCTGCNMWYTFPLCPYYYDNMCSHLLGCVMSFHDTCPASTYETNARYEKVTDEDRKAHFYKTKEAYTRMEGVVKK